jgi:hypothetical protein
MKPWSDEERAIAHMPNEQRPAEAARIRHEIEVTTATLKRVDDDHRIAEMDVTDRGMYVERIIHDTHRKEIRKMGLNPSIQIIDACTRLHTKLVKRLDELRARLAAVEEPRNKWVEFQEKHAAPFAKQNQPGGTP